MEDYCLLRDDDTTGKISAFKPGCSSQFRFSFDDNSNMLTWFGTSVKVYGKMKNKCKIAKKRASVK